MKSVTKQRQLNQTLMLFFAFMFSYINIDAQTMSESSFWTKEDYFKVYLKNRNSFIGRFVSETADEFTMMVGDSSSVTVHESDIKNVKKLRSDKIKNWRYRPDNQFAHRYFISPSAFNLAKEEISVNSSLLFYKNLEYGLSNHISAGTGISLYPYIIDDINGPYVNMFKIKAGGWKLIDNIHYGFNGFYSLINDNNFYFYSQDPNKKPDHHLSLSGLITFGNRDINATFGLGGYRYKGIHYYYGQNFEYREEFKSSIFTTININGMARISRSIYLVTENWLINSDYFGNKYSFGVRYAFDKLLIEAAIIRQNYIDYFYEGYYDVLPLLTISYKF